MGPGSPSLLSSAPPVIPGNDLIADHCFAIGNNGNFSTNQCDVKYLPFASGIGSHLIGSKKTIYTAE